MALVVQIGAEVRGAVKGIEDVTLKLKDQKAILASLQKQYAALSTQQARGVIGKEIAADIKIAQQEIKRLEVGAVSSFGKVGGAASKSLSVVKGLANILPGVGLAGLFGLAIEGIGALISELSRGSKAVNEFKASQQSLNKAFESSSYSKAVTDVKELTANIDLAKKGFLDKADVLRQYNERLGESIGKAKSLDEAEKLLIKNGDAYIRMTLLKAAANIALNEAAGKVLEAEKTRLRNEREFSRFTDAPSLGAAGQGGAAALKAAEKELQEIRKRRREARALQQEEESRTFENIAKEFQRKAAEIAKASNIDFFGFGDDKAKANIKKKIEEFIAPIQDLKFETPIKLEPVFNLTRFRQVVLNDIPKKIGELVDEAIAEANRKLADSRGPDKNTIVVEAELKIKKAKTIEDELENVIKGINKQIEGIKLDSLANVGEAIGAALSGGDLRSAFTNFGNIIGEGLQALGKEFIKFGLIALKAKEAITKLFTNPALAIGAGILLIAAGAALKNAVSGGLPGRHAGGAVAGGQTYIVGENGPEVFTSSTSGRILPNNQLGGIQGSASQLIKVEVDGIVQGNNIKLVLARTEKLQRGNV